METTLLRKNFNNNKNGGFHGGIPVVIFLCFVYTNPLGTELFGSAYVHSGFRRGDFILSKEYHFWKEDIHS